MKRISIVRSASLLVVALGALLLAGCVEPDSRIKTGDTALQDANITDTTVKALNSSQPIPSYTYSQERTNLIKRHNLFNTAEKVTYIALVSYGKVMETGVVKGKVSSLNSLLTNPQQPVPVKSGRSDMTYEYLLMPSPDIDGSYGDNPKGIFWFDPQGHYHEWGGEGATYELSDTPFTLTTPPVITVNLSQKEATGSK